MAGPRPIRQIICTGLIAAILMNALGAFGQTGDDSRNAKIAAAMKIFSEAVASGNSGNDAVKLASLVKLKGVEKVFEELKDDENLAYLYTIEGTYLFVLRQFDPAIGYLEKAIPIFRKLNNPAGEAACLLTMGNLYLKRREPEKARIPLEEALRITDKTPIAQIDQLIRKSLANAYIALKDGKKAIQTFQNAYRVAALVSDNEAAMALKNAANGYVEMSMAASAPALLEKALKHAENAKLPGTIAEILCQLGTVYLYHLSKPEKARGYFLEAQKTAAPLDLPALKAEVLDGLGQSAFRLMDSKTAMECYVQALSHVPKFPDSEGRHANLLFNVAQINLLLNENAKAREALELARPLARKANEPMIEAKILQTLSNIADTEGDLKRALELSNEAGSIIVRQPNPGREAVEWVIQFSMLALRGGLRTEPIDSLTKMLPKARELGYEFGEASIWDSLGVAYYNAGDHKKAVESYHNALMIFRSLGLKPREARTLENLMTAWAKLGNPNLAVFFGKSSVNIFQTIRKNSGLTAVQQKAFSENFATAYRNLSQVLIEQGRIAEAEQVLTLLKQEELLEYVRRDDTVAKEMLATVPVSDEEKAAIARYGSFAEQLTTLGKEFGDLETERLQFDAGAFPKQKRYDEVKQQLADANLVFEKFLEELKLKFGQKNTSVAQVDSGLKKMLAGLNTDKPTAVVSTIVGDDALNIIVTTDATQRAHTIKVTSKEINALVAKFRTALTSPQYDPRPLGQQLYDLIVKPIEGDLAGIKVKTILWSMDGTLRYIPPAAIWDRKSGYMAERFENVMINLASRDGLDKPRAPGQLSALGVGVSKPVEGFSALTAVPDELDCIVADKTNGVLSPVPQCSTGVLTGRKLLDEKFTLANFEAELGRYPIVHIASHFKLTPGDDKNSFLLLGGGADRKLTVEKLRNEPLTKVDLIVFSACNTATPGGALANGIEVEGFGSIAQKEGAKSVMATLWSVADMPTKDFMVEFYRLYGKQGLSKAAALRKAQLKFIDGKYSANEAQKHRADEFVTAPDKTLPKFTSDPNAPFAHPFYWSPFTLIGNWR